MKKPSFVFCLAALLALAVFTACQNINVDTAIVDPCTFNYATGKYSAPFDLEIENDDPEVEIWYTDDGTTPTQGGGTSQEYSATVSISRTTTIKAKGYKPGLRASNERSATFTFVWTRGADMPGGSNFYGRIIFGCTELDGKIYCIGGLEKVLASVDAVKTVLVYDPASDSWSTAPDISSERQGVEAVTYDGKIYIIGGADADGVPVATVEVFDPAGDGGNGEWTVKTPMPTARNAHKVAVIGTKIFAFGGWNGSYEAAVEAYDPDLDSWTTTYESMPDPDTDFGLGVVGSKAYLFGGYSVNTSRVNVYDSDSDTWSTATAMLSGRSGAQAIARDGIINVLGGNITTDESVATVEEFDPAANGGDGAWTPRTSMPRARGYFGIAADTEHVYAISGWAMPGPAFNKYVDIYEPSADD